LPIEVCRGYGILLSDRTCTLCGTVKLADAFLFILECEAIFNLRKKILAPRYCQAPNERKFIALMTSSNLKTLKPQINALLYIYN
jgi:hypothetical protein